MMSKAFARVPRGVRKKLATFAMIVLVAGLPALGCGKDETPVNGEKPVALAMAGERERPDAPDLFGGIGWLNTSKPISLEDLRGRVVLLDFWTLCCINCIHVLPDLAKLEAKYPGVLVVIGVHTPKFPNEKNSASIRKAILRYRIAHPVVNDANHTIWRRYGVNSWPTLMLIDPEGKFYGRISGEGVYDVLDQHIGKLVKEYKAKKKLKETPIEFNLDHEQPKTLFFPGKVLADQKGNRLFIADSTNNRIVITDLEGKKIAVAGSGKEGQKDGGFAQATFSDPQGMALDGNTLYVADRKNHLIRALDLKAEKVTTIAGTGEQDRGSRVQTGPPLKIGLNSPWDLLLHGKKMFIAMAGHHQVWALDFAKDEIGPYAGSGREDLEDGPLKRSALAQPSGLASDGKNLYVADSEISAIRAMPLDGTGEVSTVVGEGLFEFGDINGKGGRVRLQHALGVAYRNGKLYVADTYNSKIKLIDPEERTCETFAGDAPGWLADSLFNEPGGLSFAGDKLYVADTNAHRIRVIDMKTKAISTLNLQGVDPVEPERAKKTIKIKG
ncbi:MAG: redoxin domain-containing protein [Planctomycetes bacterium]|nr:redoxin domain-containing protein [Planctomycetota bacterium]